MRTEPYRRVLALPGVRNLILVALLARIPVTAAGMTLTLHVVLNQGRGYGAAGLVMAATTIGSGIGAPLLGRFVDRAGLRPVLVLTTAASAAFWTLAPSLPYRALVPAAFVSGLLGLPVFNVVRQSLAALVPEHSRRPAYSLDSMSVELSYMAGPALAVVAVTSFSAIAAMWALGGSLLLSGLALYLLNPPTRSAHELAVAAGDPGPSRRDWFRPGFVAVLTVVAAATLVLSGTEVGIVAVLRRSGEVGATGTVMAAWCAYSLIGGFFYGSARRTLPAVLLIALLGLLTIPVGLAHSWWLLCLVLAPTGMMCAPTIAATADAVSRMVPFAARGEAMGWYASALTAGGALGSPAIGTVADRIGPAWGFVVAGLAGLAVAGGALLVNRMDPGTRAGEVDRAAPEPAEALPRAA